VNRPASIRMAYMDERLARLRTLSLAATVLLGGTLPAASQEPAAPVAAGGTVYNIELIVFRATTALGGAENWSAEAGERTIAGEESTSDSAQVGHFVAQLPVSGWQLTELENRLRASGNYVPVAHAAWSQTASSWGTRAGFSVQRLGLNAQGLAGTVFLERGQFLHLGLSLTYAMPSPPEGLRAAPDTPFTLNQSRRVRFYERAYYDHPAFGVIALVTPSQGARAPGR
jgi:Peptidoglycan-binding protein, CsiV